MGAFLCWWPRRHGSTKMGEAIDQMVEAIDRMVDLRCPANDTASRATILQFLLRKQYRSPSLMRPGPGTAFAYGWKLSPEEWAMVAATVGFHGG